MCKRSFGTKGQIQCNEHEFYQALGYLCRNNGHTSVHWESNENQGAWGSEGRIHFYVENPKMPGVPTLSYTAGNYGAKKRVNCNEFVKELFKYGFKCGIQQDAKKIRENIPCKYLNDFDIGLNIQD